MEKNESRRKDKLEQVAMFPARHAERESVPYASPAATVFIRLNVQVHEREKDAEVEE